MIDEAQSKGAPLRQCCNLVGIHPRTVQRWRKEPDREDMRMGPKKKPANSFSDKERKEILKTVNSAEYRDLSPNQIVPLLASAGIYIASESTIFRILREQEQNTHRGRKKPKSASKPRELVASGPCEVWSWDITYLPSQVAGVFYYLYMAIDVWSRKIVAFEVYERECSQLATTLLTAALDEYGYPPHLALHQDNGSAMKGTLKVKMEQLGVAMSYNRPHVSDDNPFSESLFGTMKTHDSYPTTPFASLEAARAWVAKFVHWYNHVHLHSAISYVTPHQRHAGEHRQILQQRKEVYRLAQCRNPERWSGHHRQWVAPEAVYLNPSKATLLKLQK